jgi:hypothetical protein
MALTACSREGLTASALSTVRAPRGAGAEAGALTGARAGTEEGAEEGAGAGAGAGSSAGPREGARAPGPLAVDTASRQRCLLLSCSSAEPLMPLACALATLAAL